MRIQTISVTQLFGIFDHTVSLNHTYHITIVYGPNGYGKTYLLNAVNDLFGLSFERLGEAPFSTLTVGLDDGRSITVNRVDIDAPGIESIEITGQNGEKSVVSTDAFTDEFGGSINVRFIDTERLIQYSDTKRDRPVINICAESLRQMVAEHSIDDSTSEKIDLLASIVNSRFNHKRMVIDQKQGFYFETVNGMRLRPDQLSSGEKHAVIILFELLFNIESDSLILIDEPELSLHIYWQQQFIADLERIIRFNDFDVLVATHSPQIIHDRWDLAVELGGPAE